MIGCNEGWFLNIILLILIAGCMLTGCQNAAQDLDAPLSIESSPSAEISLSTSTSTLLPSPMPTPTPPSPPTLIPQQPLITRAPTPCLDDLEVVLDLSLGAENGLPLLPLGSRIEKGWRVRNTGTCTWDSAYLLVIEQEDQDWTQVSWLVTLNGSVKPGDMYDFWVDLEAPQISGIYRADWSLQDGRGEAVGTPLTLSFEVVPLAAETALPDVALIASPLEILRGEEAHVTWFTKQAKAAYLYPAGLAWREHPVEVNGSMVVQPERTTTYELRVIMGDDSVEIRRVTIEIVPFDPPKIRSFIIHPDNVIDLGQCVDILWRISGRVNTVQVLRNGVYFWESLDETGDTWDCPEESGFFTYILQVAGPGGIVDAKRVLEVR